MIHMNLHKGIKNRRLSFLTGILILLFTGCAEEEKHITPENDVTVTVSLRIPGLSQSVTRALEGRDEGHIETLDLLVFSADTDTYLYNVHAKQQGDVTTQYNALLKPGAGRQHRFVLLANCRTEIETAGEAAGTDALPGFAGKSRTEVMDLIRFTVDTHGWNTAADGTHRPLPMWGEAEAKTVGNDGEVSLGTVSMLRSVVRIDVGINLTAIDPNGTTVTGGLPEFKLSEVRICNNRKEGYAAPLDGNLDLPSPTYTRVTDTSIPAGAAVQTVTHRHEAADNGFIREIYLSEVRNHTADGAVLPIGEQCYLLLGGYYSSAPLTPNTTVITWYRVDFHLRDETDPDTRMDLLRNHCYTVNIRQIDGSGFPTPEEAAIARPENIVIEIAPWDSGNLGNVVSDGKHYLSVDRETISLFIDGSVQTFRAATDYSGGWRATVSADAADWLAVSPLISLPNSGTTVSVEATPLPAPLKIRTGEIILTAGRLQKRVQVTQTDAHDYRVSINPATLVFRKSAPFPKSVSVNVTPAGLPLNFNERAGVLGGLTWRTGGFPSPGPITTLDFHPEINNGTNTLSSMVMVHIQTADGSIVGQMLNIRQLTTDAIFNVASPIYPPEAGSRSFTVTTAETPWQILTAAPEHVVRLTDKDVQPAGSGLTYSFNLTANPTWERREATFSVTSPDPDLIPCTIAITQESDRPAISDLNPPRMDFAGDVTPRELQFRVNSNWTATPDRWMTLADTEGTAGSPTLPKSATTVLTPPPFDNGGTPYASVPPAGIYTGRITLATKDHGMHGSHSVSYPYTRIVPTYFTYTSHSPATLPWEGGTVGVTVNTNNRWKLQSAQQQVPVSMEAGTYGTKTLAINILPNTSPLDRTVAVSVYNGDEIGKVLHIPQPKCPTVIPDFKYAGMDDDGGPSVANFTFGFANRPSEIVPGGSLVEPLTVTIKIQGLTWTLNNMTGMHNLEDLIINYGIVGSQYLEYIGIFKDILQKIGSASTADVTVTSAGQSREFKNCRIVIFMGKRLSIIRD